MSFRYFAVLGVVVHLIEGESAVTTASQTEATSARPTTLMRRIEVRKADYNAQQTTEIFDNKREGISRRRLSLFSELWKWDYWCMLQPVTGNCGLNRTKYYYNTQLDQCLPHLFSVCHITNMNQFDSVADCENHCKGSALMPPTLPDDTDICKLQPISGRCLGHMTMYYYDVNQGTCNTFVYGGCAGNKNKFTSGVECLNSCKHLG